MALNKPLELTAHNPEALLRYMQEQQVLIEELRSELNAARTDIGAIITAAGTDIDAVADVTQTQEEVS